MKVFHRDHLICHLDYIPEFQTYVRNLDIRRYLGLGGIWAAPRRHGQVL